jgi:hypothetical protein
MSNFVKICPVGAEVFHADGRTNGRTGRHAKPIVAFRDFANAPRMIMMSRWYYYMMCFVLARVCDKATAAEGP